MLDDPWLGRTVCLLGSNCTATVFSHKDVGKELNLRKRKPVGPDFLKVLNLGLYYWHYFKSEISLQKSL